MAIEYRVFTVFILVLLSGCRKDKVSYPETMIIGDESQVSVTLHDVVVDGDYYQADTYEMDVDGDGENDLMFESKLVGSPGMGMHPYAVVSRINQDLLFCGNVEKDSTFYRDTLVFLDDPNGGVLAIYSTEYSCQETTGSILDEVENTFHSGVYYGGELIQMDDIFQGAAVNVTVQTNSGTGLQPTGVVVQDTTYYEATTYFNGCDELPQDTDYYLVFKLKPGILDRLGWIQIRVSGEKITILKSGIQ